MTPSRSAFALRMAALGAGMLALLWVLAPAFPALGAAGGTTTPAPPVSASLLASSTTIPLGQTFSYIADIRLPRGASYLQAVFQVQRTNGQILFKRTKIAYALPMGAHPRYQFTRDLTGALSLSPGEYPVKLAVTANVQGATVATEEAGTLRVYSANGPHVRLALVARVNGQPMSQPDGRFSIDPGQATGARDAVSRISHRVLSDTRVNVTLSVPPVLLAEWRRLSGGYTLATGVTVRPDAPVAVAYNSALADLKAALDTGRLELTSSGYSDPNLTDLADHGLTKDVGPQYDAGISAVFASLQATPSAITAPSGGCVPPNQVDILSDKGVRSIVIDSDCARADKSAATSGPYQLSHDDLRALVFESTTTAALSRGETDTAIGRAFVRLVRLPRQPLVMSVDVDGDSNPATDTVGLALDAFEAQPWLQLVSADDLKPAASTAHIRLASGSKTPHAPKGFWKAVAKSRAFASGYYAALGSGDTLASTAEVQSLVAEASSWSEPNETWSSASRGLEFANASLKSTSGVLQSIHVKVESLTLSGSSGEVPITVVNTSGRTLNVVVRVVSAGGVHLSGPRNVPTTLRPQENYLEVPVEMQGGLSGTLVVEVLAGDLVIASGKAGVQASYLDRLAIVGGIVLLGIGVLVFIVRRVRSVPEAPHRSSATRDVDGYEYHDEDTSPR